MLDSSTVRSLATALDGLMARERAIGDNIANVNTPFYTARTVAFENDLRRAVETGEDPGAVAISRGFSDAAPGLTGNNVSLDAETVAAIETSLRYDLALRATGDRFQMLRTAARGM